MTAARNNYFFFLAVFLVLSNNAIAQEQKPAGSNPPQQTSPQKRVTATDSIVVGAHLTPEEIEDGKINDAYQPLYHLKKPHDCAEIVTLSETKVIPMAEQSKFELTRNKFLFLANREIADCDLYAGKGEEAEKRYQKLFDFIPVWPGKDDSDFPINYQSIGTARLMQGHWKEAEEALEKANAIFDDQIERAMHSDSEFMRNEHSKNLKMSEAQSRNYLAAAYFRDGRQSEAMEMLEKAYQEALQSNASVHLVQQIVNSGREASVLLGDVAAKAKWDARTPAAPK
ncbi:MAG TPA: tetratricopeptide repeat protein [Candidatus Acidoferrum sp.]|nr:tetratricopeptide repeat protein [Candidatus Acidoferrum sp.]